jgi:hypothetical protein
MIYRLILIKPSYIMIKTMHSSFLPSITPYQACIRPYLAERTGRNNSYRLFSISVIFCSNDAKREGEGEGESSMVILAGLCVL